MGSHWQRGTNKLVYFSDTDIEHLSKSALTLALQASYNLLQSKRTIKQNLIIRCMALNSNSLRADNTHNMIYR